MKMGSGGLKVNGETGYSGQFPNRNNLAENAIQAYCKFSEVPVNIIHTINPWRTLTGQLPVLREEKEQLTDTAGIFDYLRKKSWGTDFDLSSRNSADVVAFTAMVEEKLVPALDHCFWVDSKNFGEFVRPWFAHAMWFPLTMIVPNRKHKAVVDRLYFCKGDRYVKEEDREYKIYRDAKECLTSLSLALGDKDYFFGRMPSSFDAIIFGYLAPLLKAPLPNPALQNHLKACENLCAFCRRILEKYFPLTPEEEAKIREAEEMRKESSEFPHSTRNTILAAAVAVSAMVVYSLASGLVQIQIGNDNKVKSSKNSKSGTVKAS